MPVRRCMVSIDYTELRFQLTETPTDRWTESAGREIDGERDNETVDRERRKKERE